MKQCCVETRITAINVSVPLLTVVQPFAVSTVVTPIYEDLRITNVNIHNYLFIYFTNSQLHKNIHMYKAAIEMTV